MLFLKVNSLLMSFFQAVSDNNKAMKALMEQLADRVKAMSEACKDAVSDEAKERMEAFIRYSLLWSIFI
jgi:hypothetical protein